MTDYQLNTKETYHLMKDPAFWKQLKVGDVVGGREVIVEAKERSCGWPMLYDLMNDEGIGWMVCRAGFEHPWCGCPHEMEEEE